MPGSTGRLAAVVLAVGALGFAACGDDGSGGTSVGPTLKSDPVTLKAAAGASAAGALPQVIAVGGGTAWVRTEAGVVPVATKTLTVGKAIPAPGGAGVKNLTLGPDGSLFFLTTNGAVGRIDTNTLKAGPVSATEFKAELSPLAATPEAVWLGAEDSLIRFDPKTLASIGEPLQIGGAASGLAAAGGKLIVVAPYGNRRVPNTSGIGDPRSIAGPDQQIEADTSKDDRVLVVDPATAQVVAESQIDGVDSITTDGTRVWVSVYGEDDTGQIQEIDPATAKPKGDAVDLDTQRLSLAVGGGAYWIKNTDNAVEWVGMDGPKKISTVKPALADGNGDLDIADVVFGDGNAWVAAETQSDIARITAEP